MKTTAWALILATGVALADSTNVLVRVAGRLQSTAQIEQLVVAQARRLQTQFDFAGVRPQFTVFSNRTAIISMWCAQTNGTYFYATVDSRGAVQAQELTLRDVAAIKALLTRETTNVVTQVWLGPDGRVGASTIVTGKDEGEFFWLRRVRGSWTIHDRAAWKTLPPLPPIRLAPDSYTG